MKLMRYGVAGVPALGSVIEDGVGDVSTVAPPAAHINRGYCPDDTHNAPRCAQDRYQLAVSQPTQQDDRQHRAEAGGNVCRDVAQRPQRKFQIWAERQ